MAFRVDGDEPLKPIKRQDNQPKGEKAKNNGSGTVPVGQGNQPQENSEVVAWTKGEPTYSEIQKFKEQNALAIGQQLNKDFPKALAAIEEKQKREIAEIKKMANGRGVPIPDYLYYKDTTKEDWITFKNILLNMGGLGCSTAYYKSFDKDFGKTIHNDTVMEFYTVGYDTIFIDPNPGPGPGPGPAPEEDEDVFDIAAKQTKIDDEQYQSDIDNKHDKKIKITFDHLRESLEMLRGIEVGDILDKNSDIYSAKVRAGFQNSPIENADVTITRQSENANEFEMKINYKSGNENVTPTVFDDCKWQAVGNDEIRIKSNARGLVFGDRKYNNVNEYLEAGAKAYSKNCEKVYSNIEDYLKALDEAKMNGKDTSKIMAHYTPGKDEDFGGADLVLKYEKRPDGNYYPMCYVKAPDGSYWINQYFMEIENQE